MSDYWRAIDTAPDGLTDVMLWFPDEGKAAIGQTFHYSHGGIGIVCPIARGAKPSHWMPAPRPPLTHSGDPA